MVLIISFEDDFSTGEVVRWLIHSKTDFIRVNENDSVSIELLNHNEFLLKIDERTIKLSEIRSVWYRRGNLNVEKLSDNPLGSRFNLYNGIENDEIIVHIHNLLNKKKSINNFNLYHANKLDVLNYCHEKGLNSANFIVTQSKKELMNFLEKENQVISKPVKSPFVLLGKDYSYYSYTCKVEKNEIHRLPEKFTPTFFQTLIPKKYEIRTFYLAGQFYSMAIFSQNNSQTKIDFRQYDWNNPNRNCPYQLPAEYEKKLDEMLKYFRVNCASLDTIVSPNGSFYMIDVNPIGQFGMTSRPCNYNIEKIIADYLAT